MFIHKDASFTHVSGTRIGWPILMIDASTKQTFQQTFNWGLSFEIVFIVTSILS